MRDSGVAPLGNVPWGTHVCHFYETKTELLEVLIPYFLAGLKNNECCVWVCSYPLGAEEAQAALLDTEPGFDRHITSGQMQIESYDRWYLNTDGDFEGADVLAKWRRKLAEVCSDGYAGLRVAGNTSWLNDGLWDAFAAYEADLCGEFGKDSVLVMCSYPCAAGRTPDIVDVIRTHQYALVRKERGWDLVECGRYWEKEWESLFDAIGEGILVVGEDGKILEANRALLECLGVWDKHELGQDLVGFEQRFALRPDPALGSAAFHDILRSDTRRQYWLAFASPSESSLEFLVTVRPVRSTAALPKRYLLLFHDVTEVRRLERMKDRFVQVMGHELKNPLQVIKALIPLMSMVDAGDAPALKRYVNTIKGQITELSSLVEDMLIACAVEERELPVLRREVDLVRLAADWIDSLSLHSGHRVIQRFARDKQARVFVDEKRVRGVLQNLFCNAAKYSPEGTTISVDVEVLSDHVIVTLDDEGIGIPYDELEQVFQAFYRATNVTSRAADGIGLGLYISRKIARQHDGDLWAETREGGGTRMVLRLPLLVG